MIDTVVYFESERSIGPTCNDVGNSFATSAHSGSHLPHQPSLTVLSDGRPSRLGPDDGMATIVHHRVGRDWSVGRQGATVLSTPDLFGSLHAKHSSAGKVVLGVGWCVLLLPSGQATEIAWGGLASGPVGG
jgi:hypothetical protein